MSIFQGEQMSFFFEKNVVESHTQNQDNQESTSGCQSTSHLRDINLKNRSVDHPATENGCIGKGPVSNLNNVINIIYLI